MTPAPPLLDADARETFVTTPDENFCVSAGAGVGKTTAITRRIANLALHRHGEPGVLSKLVVVTYGKLAAEELRIRTRDLVLQQLDKSAQGRQTLLADLRGAFFGTIHSFCLKLIREQGRFLGLPETVDLLEERDAGPLWERFCESDVVDNLGLPPELLARVSRHLSFDQLLELARHLGPEVTEVSGAFLPADEPPPLDFSAALDDDGGRSKDRTQAHQRNLRKWIAEYDSGAPFVELPEYSGGSKTFLAAVDAATEPYARWLNEAAGALAVRIARAFRDFRLEKGLMTYRDQIFWCKRLVEDPAVLARLRARQYRVILDEAQDTDAEMFAILTEIARPVDAPAGTWPDQPDAPGPEPGRFSFVGDDQQAIYGERADLAIYQRYIEAFKAGRGGKHLEFSVTMRCPRAVIDVVNGVFADGRLPQAVTFRSLAPRPNCPDGAAWRLDVAPMPGGDGRPSQGEQLVRECEQIADFVAAHDLAGLGLSRWSEMAVICPRIGWLETCAQIFADRGIPGSLLSQKRIAREQARHSWPAALLHVLVHPWDRFELIGVLREIFAVSDVDMARLHRRQSVEDSPGLSFWPLAPARTKGDIPSPRLRQALELLHELRAAFPIDTPKGGGSTHGLSAAEGAGTLSRYVDLVLEKTALAARLETIGEPSEHARTPARLGVARRVRTRHPARLGALAGGCPGGTHASLRGRPQTAVQFLTCLKAKGLEWPVVIPLGMGHRIGERTAVYPRVVRHEGKSQIHFSGVTVDPAQKNQQAIRCAEEFQRMLYVTLTRAKRLLLVPDSSALYAGRPPNFLELARWDELDLPETLRRSARARWDQPPAATGRTRPWAAVVPRQCAPDGSRGEDFAGHTQAPVAFQPVAPRPRPFRRRGGHPGGWRGRPPPSVRGGKLVGWRRRRTARGHRRHRLRQLVARHAPALSLACARWANRTRCLSARAADTHRGVGRLDGPRGGGIETFYGERSARGVYRGWRGVSGGNAVFPSPERDGMDRGHHGPRDRGAKAARSCGSSIGRPTGVGPATPATTPFCQSAGREVRRAVARLRGGVRVWIRPAGEPAAAVLHRARTDGGGRRSGGLIVVEFVLRHDRPDRAGASS